MPSRNFKNTQGDARGNFFKSDHARAPAAATRGGGALSTAWFPRC